MQNRKPAGRGGTEYAPVPAMNPIPRLLTLLVMLCLSAFFAPVPASAQTMPQIRAYFDRPLTAVPAGQPFAISGWAFNAIAADTGIDSVVIRYMPLPMVPGAKAFELGAATYGIDRNDVAQHFGAPQFRYSGFTLQAPALPPGEYAIIAFFHKNNATVPIGFTQVDLTVFSPGSGVRMTVRCGQTAEQAAQALVGDASVSSVTVTNDPVRSFCVTFVTPR